MWGLLSGPHVDRARRSHDPTEVGITPASGCKRGGHRARAPRPDTTVKTRRSLGAKDNTWGPGQGHGAMDSARTTHTWRSPGLGGGEL